MNKTNSMISRAKNHPLILVLIFLGTIVIYMATFTDAAKKLIELVTPPPAMSPEAARIELSRLMLPYTADTFIEAAEKGDVQAINLFLTAGMDPNAEDSEYGRAIYSAVRGRKHSKNVQGHPEIVRVLVKAKARIDSSELSLAAQMEDAEILQLLLEGSPDRKFLNEAFLSAAGRSMLNNMKLLLRNGADLKAVGEAALLSAADSRKKREMGGLWDYRSGVSEEKIHETVLFLLKNGVDVNLKSDSGITPLYLAAQRGSSNVVRALLDRGAEVNTTVVGGHGWTSLTTALLYSNGVPTNEESLEIVKALLAKGADVNAKDKYGKTALMLATGSRDKKIVQALLEAGAQVKDKDKYGQTAAFALDERYGNNTPEERKETSQLLKDYEDDQPEVVK
ncbi:ankyrin repeat domain-containing protein [Nitrosomonas mobilis]|uniref:Uncharacterized protein n=1 Tax=Nitrosomonas mobilis TaxID=51642 RepID=A0A1G5SIW5_9PROT|nr:ankyrin repeat domain-containing protein [Nitrosomonas mobilis]SCZ87032.1 exported hypothetical protein [Nitrosomonas mobilis]